MKLIKSIEIRYFRSLYSTTLRNVGDLNIVFGKNDMGKSNLLRALDLFFNCENIDTQFELDFSDHRKSIASSESVKGQQFF